MSGTWTNAPVVSINLSATDTGGSGVKEIVYSATGAQPIEATTVAGASASLSITNQGITNVTYAARDIAGTVEAERTLTVMIDTTNPSLTGAVTTLPNAAGWYDDDATIDWTCSDAESGIAGDCPADSVISGEGYGLSVSASVSDHAGNQTTASVSGINIDRTAPITTISPIPDWSNGSVTVDFFASDNLSPVTTFYQVNGGPQSTGNQVILNESGVYSLTFWSEDAAGNAEEARTAEIGVDTIAPSIGHTLTPEPNPADWHNAPVTITFVCADDPSGIAVCSEPQTLTADGANQTVTGTAVDVAGNSATDTASVNIDQTAPEISASRTPDDNGHGWNDTTVTVTFACNDATSGITDCPAAQTVGEGASQRVSGTTTDLAGNAASVTVIEINVDLTPPEITATATTADGMPYVAGSWANQPVTVSYACRDALSGIASCPEPQTFGEGTNQIATGTALDVAGNRAGATIEHINVDAVGPTITATAATEDGQPYVSGTWTNQAVTVTFTCGDAISGLAGSCPAPVVISDSTAVAGQLVSAQMSDLAGNTASSNEILVLVDMDAPSFTSIPGNLVVDATDATGSAVTWDAPVAVDAITGAVDPVCVPHSGAFFEIGTTTVTCTAADAAGNVATAGFMVTVNDARPPVLNVPEAIVVPADNPSGAVVTYDITAGDALSRAASPATCAPASGSFFPLGTTVVTCWAADPTGNSASASFSVTVLSAADLLTTLRDDTETLITNRATERVFLRTLDQAQMSLDRGHTLRAYAFMLRFTVEVEWYARLGRLSPEVAEQLQTQARQVIGAMW